MWRILVMRDAEVLPFIDVVDGNLVVLFLIGGISHQPCDFRHRFETDHALKRQVGLVPVPKISS